MMSTQQRYFLGYVIRWIHRHMFAKIFTQCQWRSKILLNCFSIICQGYIIAKKIYKNIVRIESFLSKNEKCFLLLYTCYKEYIIDRTHNYRIYLRYSDIKWLMRWHLRNFLCYVLIPVCMHYFFNVLFS